VPVLRGIITFLGAARSSPHRRKSEHHTRPAGDVVNFRSLSPFARPKKAAETPEMNGREAAEKSSLKFMCVALAAPKVVRCFAVKCVPSCSYLANWIATDRHVSVEAVSDASPWRSVENVSPDLPRLGRRGPLCSRARTRKPFPGDLARLASARQMTRLDGYQRTGRRL
jgi:hypothetical protein